jgi:probable O-glycosylation ligase (exosortase A-associated)
VRDWIVLFIVAATIPLAFYRPYFGLLGFSWLAYMRPQDLSWGLADSMPLSKYLALAIFASLAIRGKINIFRPSRVTFAMLGLWLWLLITCFMSQSHDIAFAKFQEITKIFLVAFMTVAVIADSRRYLISISVIAVSLGLLGLKYGLYGLLRGGVQFHKGVGGMIGDNNDFALALNMTVPMLLFAATQLPKKWMRLGCAALVPLTLITIIYTNSRGGFLSLCAVTGYLILHSRRKFVTLAGVAVVVAVGSFFVPPEFYERMGTIASHNDSSSVGRLNAWAAAWEMSKDYPIFGVGLDNFLHMFTLYAPDPDDVHVAHNTYFQMLAETGFVGLGIYVALLGTTFWTLWGTRRRAKKFGIEWAVAGSKCLEASLVAFVVGATFLNRAHFDLTYHVLVLSVCLERISNHEIAGMKAELLQGARVERAA